jgi:signal transduction histidine kinase
VRADSAKLRQILINLLGNAVKFTPSGGKVSLSAEATPDGGLVFRIADTGIGIPADKMDVAMAPFGQVDSSLARKYEGTGLGLPLTKRLVEMHGGTFHLTSEPGRGTIATVRLPKVPAPTPLMIAV